MFVVVVVVVSGLLLNGLLYVWVIIIMWMVEIKGLISRWVGGLLCGVVH